MIKLVWRRLRINIGTSVRGDTFVAEQVRNNEGLNQDNSSENREERIDLSFGS